MSSKEALARGASSNVFVRPVKSLVYPLKGVPTVSSINASNSWVMMARAFTGTVTYNVFVVVCPEHWRICQSTVFPNPRISQTSRHLTSPQVYSNLWRIKLHPPSRVPERTNHEIADVQVLDSRCTIHCPARQ